MNVAKRASTYQAEVPIRAKITRTQQQHTQRRKINPMIKIALVGVLVSLLLLIYIAEKNIIMGYVYELDNLTNQLTELKNQQERLSLQLMDLQSLDRIENIAKAQLGMVKPADVKYIALKPEATSPANQPENVAVQIAEFINDVFTSVAKAAGLY